MSKTGDNGSLMKHSSTIPECFGKMLKMSKIGTMLDWTMKSSIIPEKFVIWIVQWSHSSAPSDDSNDNDNEVF